MLQHIQTAFRHWSRGHEGDEAAFTDAIYRANQAFEGSIKEAYRVLTGKNPSKQSPYDIERYLENNNVFRDRVLKQFTTYRTEWRNPSTHDYQLNFDESESFLAIISVTAFACVLLDQIIERLAYLDSQTKTNAQTDIQEQKISTSSSASLATRVVQSIQHFLSSDQYSIAQRSAHSEMQVIGALHGFLASVDPKLSIQIEAKLGKESRYRADLLISEGESRVLIEIKRKFNGAALQNSLFQVERYMSLSSIRDAILLFETPDRKQIHVAQRKLSDDRGTIFIIGPSDFSQVYS